jgi:hypothetical protein
MAREVFSLLHRAVFPISAFWNASVLEFKDVSASHDLTGFDRY